MMREVHTSRICVSIGNSEMAEAVRTARQVAALADVIEIRLDCIVDPVIPDFFSALRCPLLFTNRPTWEGGMYTGPEEARVEQLVKAVAAGCAYADLELQAPASSLMRLREAMTGQSAQLILSCHDFTGTPPTGELLGWVNRMQECGADIGKIVTTAHDYHDVLRVLHLQEDCSALDFPLIAFCMGRAGLISRLATIELGGYMTYCAADGSEVTAPGQIAVAELRKVCGLLQLLPEDIRAVPGE